MANYKSNYDKYEELFYELLDMTTDLGGEIFDSPEQESVVYELLKEIESCMHFWMQRNMCKE